jgi:flagellar assembly protein FliH
LSDQKENHDEGWKPMDVGSLRKFIREDIPTRPLPTKGRDENFSTIYSREHTPEEAFRPFIDTGGKPIRSADPSPFPPHRASEIPASAIPRSAPLPGSEGVPASGGLPPSPEPEKKTAPDFTQQREAARKAGYEEGLASGRDQGHREGFEAGYNEGLASGREEGLAQGAAEGYDRGYEEGRAAGTGELAIQAGELGQLLQSIQAQWPAILARYEKEIISLALEIAETLVFGTLAVDSRVVERAVISALHRLPDPLKVTVSVNPEDFQQVEMARERFFEQAPELRQLEVASDPGISRGSCHIRAASGSIREDLKQRMHVLKETLLLAADTKGG